MSGFAHCMIHGEEKAKVLFDNKGSNNFDGCDLFSQFVLDVLT